MIQNEFTPFLSRCVSVMLARTWLNTNISCCLTVSNEKLNASQYGEWHHVSGHSGVFPKYFVQLLQ